MSEGFAKQAKELVDLLNKASNDTHKKFLNESLNWLGRAEAMQAEALHFRHVADLTSK